MHRQREQGFTLIEMMVTVAIVAILAAVAVPSYRDYVMRGKITQATNNLSAMRVKLEQYYQDNRKYVDACAANTVAELPATDDFEYTCPTLETNKFTVQAKGVSTGPMNGFTYTIDQNNAKTSSVPSSWGSSSNNCWIVKKGGTC